MLIFPLKKSWYEKIKSGEKTIEYREVKPYWTKRFKRAGCENNKGDIELLFENKIVCISPVIKAKCKLRLGYTDKYLTATIGKIEIVNGKNTDLHIDKPVYAIHLTDVKEIE
jgi:hypothetical protein